MSETQQYRSLNLLRFLMVYEKSKQDPITILHEYCESPKTNISAKTYNKHNDMQFHLSIKTK